jgi:hypothetical protein
VHWDYTELSTCLQHYLHLQHVLQMLCGTELAHSTGFLDMTGLPGKLRNKAELYSITQLIVQYEISSSHGSEYDVQSCLLGCTAV